MQHWRKKTKTEKKGEYDPLSHVLINGMDYEKSQC